MAMQPLEGKKAGTRLKLAVYITCPRRDFVDVLDQVTHITQNETELMKDELCSCSALCV